MNNLNQVLNEYIKCKKLLKDKFKELVNNKDVNQFDLCEFALQQDQDIYELFEEASKKETL